MATRGAGGRAVAPASWVIALVVALCAVLLLKWLAVVALVALGIVGFVRWARGGQQRFTVDVDDEPQEAAVPRPRVDPPPAAQPPLPAPPSLDDCRWCGLPGGHRDDTGRLVRSRHVHVMR